MTAAPRNGRIVTFYSYKGGTGRSMALANVGWILASNGHRVLLVDWDLEAPGLHRYLHPFLGSDKERASTPGLMEFFADFAAAARVAHAERAGDDRWYEASASLVRYATPVEWDFGDGALEFVAAGRQDAGYAVSVTSFNWQDFYDKLGGGVFLEALKRRLRNDYDYILIDSRTGISDTSGICTVQMPDDLVVLFTLNQQSMKGAAAIAQSADELRRTSSGLPGLRIWPVPTRVELGEKDRVDAAREECREMFEWYIGRAMPSRDDRRRYWGRVEVQYQPYYAFEEILAVFGDRTFQENSMLADMEAIASLLTLRDPIPSPLPDPLKLPKIREQLRLDMKARFERLPKRAAPPTETPFALVSYSKTDEKIVDAMVEELTQLGVALWVDQRDLRAGEVWQAAIADALQRSSVVLFLVGPTPLSDWRREELMRSLSGEKRIVPVLINGAGFSHLPEELRLIKATVMGPLSKKAAFQRDLKRLADDLQHFLQRDSAESDRPIDAEDPQKGRWGGESSRPGRELAASVRSVSHDYFEVTLEVRATGTETLTGDVEFHLHPTFRKPIQTVKATDNRARLKLLCYGAFTVGAVADDGRTTLELDLATDTRFPELFRAR